ELRTFYGRVDDLLADAADGQAHRAGQWFPAVQRVQEVLNWILIWRAQTGRCDFERLRLAARLHRDVIIVVERANRAVRARDDEPATRLRLNRPRIGKRAPARFKF